MNFGISESLILFTYQINEVLYIANIERPPWRSDKKTMCRRILKYDKF